MNQDFGAIATNILNSFVVLNYDRSCFVTLDWGEVDWSLDLAVSGAKARVVTGKTALDHLLQFRKPGGELCRRKIHGENLTFL